MRIRQRVGRGWLATLVAVVVAAAVVPAVRHGLESRDAAEHTRMRAIAAAVTDPDGLTPLPAGDCPDQTTLVRCMLSPQAPDPLTTRFRTALGSAAGRPAAGGCSDSAAWLGGPMLRNCLVRIDDGDHAVTISVDTETDRVSGVLITSGSRIRIDAD